MAGWEIPELNVHLNKTNQTQVHYWKRGKLGNLHGIEFCYVLLLFTGPLKKSSLKIGHISCMLIRWLKRNGWLRTWGNQSWQWDNDPCRIYPFFQRRLKPSQCLWDVPLR